jgi:uncharacterized protein YdaU (DUF1376 family)
VTGIVKVRSVQFSPDEWLAGTSMLSAPEKASYITVIALIYSHGGPIDDDDRWIARNIGCHWRSWRAHKQRLISLGKIHRIEPGKSSNGSIPACGQLTNKRCEKELLRAIHRSMTSSRAAQESVRTRRGRCPK